ncbi:MAG: T9SS type A sorting domain-containing protein [Flavobacteriales bacterium]|nr:T9SS type A sorting domain-containing protein [Flavobacteriales bacterium]
MKKLILTLLVLMIISTSTIFAQYTNALRITISGYGYNDETIIRFIDDATPDFDGQYDAWKLLSPNPMANSIYTTIPSNDKLSINSLPLYDTDTTIEVHTKVAASGLYTITIEEIFTFDNDFSLSFTDVDAEVTYNYSGGTLTFDCVLLPNTPTAALTFNVAKTFSTAINPIPENNDFTLATKGNGNYGLIFNNNQVKTITVYDITGKSVLNDKINGSNYQLNLVNNPAGLYIITINNGTESITRKVFR